MILTRDEAICLVLEFSDRKEVSSPTKLNKLLARLNLNLIPIDIEFSLNRYGSFNSVLQQLESNSYFLTKSYPYLGKISHKFEITQEGISLVREKVIPKLSSIFSQKDIDDLKNEILKFSKKSAEEISGYEHSQLLVDVDDRPKLSIRLHSAYGDFYDLYQEIKEKKIDDSIDNLRFSALIEYCYYLSKYLRLKKFKNIDDTDYYEYDRNMFDYYFLFHLSKLAPILKEQIKKEDRDNLLINKYYQYILNSVGDNYAFSLDNPDLRDLIEI